MGFNRYSKSSSWWSNKKSTDDYESAFEGIGFYLVTMRRKSSSGPKGRVQ